MITNLSMGTADDIILKGETEGKEFCIRFQDIFPYWDYSTVEDFEGGTAKVFGDRVLFTMLTASGQGGVIVLWNAKSGNIEHISEGSYTLAIDMDEENIYYLIDVFNFATKANLQLWRIPIGCMDANQKGERLNTTQLPSADFMIKDYGDYEIFKQDSCIEIKLADRKYSVKIL